MTLDHEEFKAWRRARWDEIAGPQGKAKVVANGVISGSKPQAIAGVPGRWSTTTDGALRLTAAETDGVVVDGRSVVGSVTVPAGSRVEFPEGLTATAMGGNGTYGIVVMDDAAVARSGLVDIETYPYDPSWVLRGEYREAPPGRTVEVDRLTSPRSRDTIPAPVDLAVTIAGEERVLTVLEDLPGRRLLIFTDETNGAGTPEIGRWLLLPLLEPGSTVAVDFNRTILSQHHFSPAVFTCPMEPAGNHLPVRVEAGERALIYRHDAPTTDRERMPNPMSEPLRDKVVAYLRHLENGEFSRAREMCTATATVWHNDGTGEQTIDENVASMERQFGAIESMHYDILRQFSADDAVLQQHVVEVVTNDGMRGRVLAAAYFRFDGDRISRIEEYSNFVPHPDADAA